MEIYLSNESRSSAGSILPVRGELVGTFVVTRETVDTRLNQNKVELAILILAVSF